MLPVIIIAVIVIPLLVLRSWPRAARRRPASIPSPRTTGQARTEQEFAEAEAYQEQWREEEKKHQRDTIL